MKLKTTSTRLMISRMIFSLRCGMQWPGCFWGLAIIAETYTCDTQSGVSRRSIEQKKSRVRRRAMVNFVLSLALAGLQNLNGLLQLLVVIGWTLLLVIVGRDSILVLVRNRTIIIRVCHHDIRGHSRILNRLALRGIVLSD